LLINTVGVREEEKKTAFLLSGKKCYFSWSPRPFYLILYSVDISRFPAFPFFLGCFASTLMKVKYIWKSVPV